MKQAQSYMLLVFELAAYKEKHSNPGSENLIKIPGPLVGSGLAMVNELGRSIYCARTPHHTQPAALFLLWGIPEFGERAKDRARMS